MQKAKLPLIILIIFWCIHEVYAQQEKEIPWINFTWRSLKMGATTYDKGAIFLDFEIEGVNRSFTSQFDTGSQSFFYDKTILSLSKKNHSLQKRIKKGAYGYFNDSPVTQVLENVTYRFNDILIKHNAIKLYPNRGKEAGGFLKRFQTIHAGTIGSTHLKDKILVIDYPNEQLAILDTLPSFIEIEKTISITFDTNNRPYLPIQIDNQDYFIMFDSGSSIFPLITFKRDFWESISSVNNNSDTLFVNSFGKKYATYEAQFKNKPVKGIPLQNTSVYLSTRPMSLGYLNDIEIIGLTGNALFLDKKIIVDYKNKQFHIFK